MDCPFTIAVFERPLKPIRAKPSNKGLPGNRRAKRAVPSNRAINHVRSFVGELSLANDYRALNGHRNLCGFTLRDGRFCRASPLPIEWTRAACGKSLAELR